MTVTGSDAVYSSPTARTSNRAALSAVPGASPETTYAFCPGAGGAVGRETQGSVERWSGGVVGRETRGFGGVAGPGARWSGGRGGPSAPPCAGTPAAHPLDAPPRGVHSALRTQE
ncbi:hypothetical protein GCM10010358_46490 [Streptomyces minutiscleroticus]|uniref:Uncharacterized protein n=1 Tax=Streptomyces minutiscleroticus TaxID=68238 RepID=A0A918U3W4_9ACTN|nr:hypothetical protein GCM10010358_46490 [Streptomyces minutiscleroticus]